MATCRLSIVLMICSVVALVSSADNLQHINGQLVRVLDNCTPGNDSTCPDGHCCVKEGLVYIPEYTGPKPTYQIACKPYRQHGEFCYAIDSNEMCPCGSPMKCQGHGSFGHCA